MFIFCCVKVWFWQIVKAIKCTHRIVSCLITTMEISKKNFFGWILGKIWKFLKLSYPVFLSPNKSIPCAVILIILYQLLASCFFAFLWWAVYSCKSPCGLNFFIKKLHWIIKQCNIHSKLTLGEKEAFNFCFCKMYTDHCN